MISERDVIYITKKQASIAVVSLTVFCILLFMLGYFWGKQSVIDGFSQKITQYSLTDAADYEYIMQNFLDKKDDSGSITPQVLADEQIVEENEIIHEGSEPIVEQESVTKKESKKDLKKAEKNIQKNKKWSAVLVRFGAKQNAVNFVQRLHDRGIKVVIKARVSKSSSGKNKRTWYQVVTTSFDSKEELEKVIHRIRKIEHLKSSDIKII